MSLRRLGHWDIGYVRVSTLDQNTDPQHAALHVAGCHGIFTDRGGAERGPANLNWI
jgi:DNA invertase Pin-like site-specific DNA recombinase